MQQTTKENPADSARAHAGQSRNPLSCSALAVGGALRRVLTSWHERMETDTRFSLKERKVSIPFDSLGDGFSEFDDDDLPPSKRVVSRDFKEELREGCLHVGLNGPLAIELTIPQSRHKPEVEAQILSRFKTHFGEVVESTRKARWAVISKGILYAAFGILVLSVYDLLQQIPIKPVQFNPAGSLLASTMETARALSEHALAFLFKGTTYGVEIIGWLFVFISLEKVVFGREQFKKDIKLARRLRDAEWLFTPRTRAEQKQETGGAPPGAATG